MTQEQAAERLGVSQPTYQRWEAGTRQPRSINLRKIAELYGVSTDSLLCDSAEDEAALVIRSEEIGRMILAGALRGLDRKQPIERQVSAMRAALVRASQMVREDPSLSANEQAVQAAASAVAQTPRD